MRQVWITRAGEPEVLQIQTAADPTPGTGEVRIRVQAIGICFADVIGRLGIYPDAPRIPYVPGYEVAGTIDLIGQGVPDLKEGDLVFAATHFGGYSDVVCVPHRQVFLRPEWMSASDAAALPVNYSTAYMMLAIMGSLQAGDKVLIHNAGGGVGLAALDICKIVGAETYGTASPQKHESLTEHGLDHPIDYRNRDYERVVGDLTGGQGVQVILDPMGGKHWSKNYRLLAPGGRLVHFGFSSAVTGKRRSILALLQTAVRIPFYTPVRLMNDNKAVAGVNLGHLWDHASLLQTWMRQIMAWYNEALFRPHIDRTFTLEQVSEAHHYIQDRHNLGKVLLTP
jgi:NADPH:quinone reductase-like Zn-dependent oxidoreductase